MATEDNKSPQNEEIKRRNIEILAAELENLHQCCVDYDINSFTTYKAAKPFLKWHSEGTRVRRSLFRLAILIGLFALAINSGPVNKYVSAASRQINIRVFSWLDWNHLKNLRCFIPNPLLRDTEGLEDVTREDCQACANVTHVTQVHDLGMEEMCNSYLNNSIPLVLTNQDIYRNGPKSIQDIIEVCQTQRN